MEFCQCGSIKKDGLCSNQRCPEINQKRKDWVVNGAQMHFKKAVLFQEAVTLAAKVDNQKNLH